MKMEKIYSHKEIEEKWYNFWLEKDFFSPKIDTTKPHFTIVIPPPNITGALHMGHALNNTLQDVIIRYKKMKGFNTLWVPGTDHGGIATQNVVEKQLLKEGLTRRDLGREKFLERMWKWKKESGEVILNQLKKLGCGLDWKRTRFTMDNSYTKTVLEAFIKLYEKKLIYRGKRIVNWCVRCQTALADIEVEYKEHKGKLYYLKYPFKDRKGEIVVATTRPETMLGDTAVAVNPKDERYKDIVGAIVILPLMNREIPVISDDAVDLNFGTGAVKVTPAHDILDFEIAERKNLPKVCVMNTEGKMTDAAGEFKGLERYECREKVLEKLAEFNLIKKTEDYIHNIGSCYRCGTPIEPLISEQWFLNVKEMARRTKEVIEADEVVFFPPLWKKFAIQWLENVKDWCISRQIWWGHRIPIWYCENKDCPPFASIEKVKKCPNCNSEKIYQEPDVLDTWFSSALWPFGVFGWPEETDELNYFYPTTTLVTGYEILYFWVLRMIKMGLFFRGKIPFKNVFIHGIIRDIYGKKMSKSIGNVIDPLDIIKEYGADALRFGLVISSSAGKDIRLSFDNFISGRNFTNKLWNATRLVLQKTEELKSIDINYQSLDIVDRWILMELKKTIKNVEEMYENYELSSAVRLIYAFFWKRYCDWYLELLKVKKDENQSVALKTLEIILRLLHPVMPFITEELWQRIKGKLKLKEDSILLKEFPKTDEIGLDIGVDERIENLISIVEEIRSVKGYLSIQPQKSVDVGFYIDDMKKLEGLLEYISFLSNVKNFREIKKGEVYKDSIISVVRNIEIYIFYEGLIDKEKQIKRLEDEKEKLEELFNLYSKKLNDKFFLEKAPMDEIEKTKTKKEEVAKKIEKIYKILKRLCQKD